MRAPALVESDLPKQLIKANKLVCESLNKLSELEIELVQSSNRLSKVMIDEVLSRLVEFKQIEEKSTHKLHEIIKICEEETECLDARDIHNLALLKEMLKEKRKSFTIIVNKLLDLRNTRNE